MVNIFDQEIRYKSKLTGVTQKALFSHLVNYILVILLCKHLFYPKSNIFIFFSLVGLSIAVHMLDVCHSSANFVRPQNLSKKQF